MLASPGAGPGDPDPACAVARSGAIDPRQDTRWATFVAPSFGEWSVSFENHGLVGVGIEVYGDDRLVPLHSERVALGPGSSGPARSAGVWVDAGAEYRYSLTPVGPRGTWAGCEEIVGDTSSDAGGNVAILAPKGGPPRAEFTFTPALPRPAQIVTFNGSASRDDGVIVSYAWTFGDGTTGSGIVATHAYAAYGSYAVTLTVTDDTARTGSASHTVRVAVPPTAAYGYTPSVPRVGSPLTFDAGASRDPDGAIASYAWTWGDGTPVATVTTPSTTHAYAAHGTYRVTLRVTDADGLWAEVSGRITIYAPPTADFTFSPSNPLAGVGVSFDGSSSSDPDSAIVAYAWAFGDGASATGRTTSHAYAAGGSYSVVLTVTGGDGFSAIATKTVRVLAPPTASFTYVPTDPVARRSVSFDGSGSTDPDGSIGSFAWTFGDGSTGSGVVVSHTFATEGSYAVTLTVTDNDGLRASLARTVSVSPFIPVPPLATFTFSPTDPLVGQSVSFDARASSDPDGTIVSYAWSFGDGSTGSGATIAHAFGAAGVFTVTLTLTDNDGVVNSTTRSVRVRAPPNASFVVSPASPLVGQVVTFDASASTDPDGTIAAYAWTFGDGGTATGRIVGHAYTAHGTYTVTLAVTDSDGLVSTSSRSIRILAPPSASFSFSPLTPRVGEAVSLDASSSRDPDGTLSAYAWTFGDGASGTGPTTTHAYASYGTVRVTLRVTDADGLWSETSARITVYAPPTADFTFSPSGPLPGAVVSFDGSGSRDPDSAIVSYAWDFGDGANGAGRQVTHAYVAYGTYTVRLTVAGSDGLAASASRTVRVLARPGAGFTYSPSNPVEGTAVTFDGSPSTDPDGTIASYSWTFGDGTTGTGKIAAHTYARYGTYTVVLTVVDSDGLSATASSAVRILGRPVASFGYSPAKPLRAQSVSFDASASSDPDGTIASYAWSFGDGTTGTGRTTSHAYSLHGTFTVILTVTDNEGVTGSVSLPVRIYAPPVTSFTFSPSNPLAGTSVSFDGSGSSDPDGSVVSYAWTWGDGSTTGPSGSPTAAHTFATYGMYGVRLTVTDSDGFTASLTTNVRILSRPTAAFTFSPAKPLAGQSVSFDGRSSTDLDGTIVSYAWTFGDSTTGTGATPNHVYGAYGTYTVTLTVTDSDGLSASTSRSVRVYAPPVAAFTFSPAKPLFGQSVSFDGRGSSDPDGTVSSYAWTFGDGSTGSGSQPSHVFATYGTYTVTLTVTDSDGFTASTSLSVRIHARPVAAFTSSPAKPLQGSTVSVDGSVSSDPDGSVLSYRWTWGDGSTSGPFGVPTASHAYAPYGSYLVTLQVTDADGFLGEISKTIRVYAAPTASFIVSPANPVRGQPAAFDASGSTDPDSPIATYAWTWGDGSTSGPLTSPTAMHTYATHGTYTAVLQVTDVDGFVSTASRSVRVVAPPVASFTYSPSVPNAGQAVNFNGGGSSDVDGTIVSYAWNFGDSTSGGGATASHVFLGGGNYTVSLTVTDSDGLTGSASQVVRVIGENRPPTAAFTLVRTLLSVAVDASPSTDPEGTITGYAWAWGDGATGSGRTASHAFGAAGVYTIRLTITDGGGLTASTTQLASVAASTLDVEFTDFFNVPYGEWWDYRTPSWGDRPLEAECFTSVAVTNGVCVPNAGPVPDVAAFPYTSWYPTPGPTTFPSDYQTNAQLFAPYRMHALGDEIPGYSLAAPVFLPVRDPTQSAGAYLDFDWRAAYVDSALADSLKASGCPVGRGDLDGYVVRSLLTIRMDLQESRRLFGVVATDVTSARAWWTGNIAAGCTSRGAAESDWQAFMVSQGGMSTVIGPYDVANALGWWYSPFYTSFTATVASDGITTLVIDHAAWGTEALLARWFYWGATPYRENHLDSSTARGWWAMEPRSLEAIAFRGTLAASAMDFTLDAVVPYGLREGALPGTDGTLNRVGDIPVWSWGPSLADVIAGPASPVEHDASELNRYSSGSYLHSVPGSWAYGTQAPYDYVPATWNLPTGHTILFRFPTGAVAFHDPNASPMGGDPSGGDYVQTTGPWRLAGTFPGPIGTWDAATATWRIIGPVTTGGPIGTPGNYPAQPYPGISFTP